MSDFVYTNYMKAKAGYKNRVLLSRFKKHGLKVCKMDTHNDICIELSDFNIWARTKDNCVLKRKGIRQNHMGDVSEAGPVEKIYICKHPDQYVIATVKMLEEMFPDLDLSQQHKSLNESRKECAEKFTEAYAAIVYDETLQSVDSWEDYHKILRGEEHTIGQLDLFSN